MRSYDIDIRGEVSEATRHGLAVMMKVTDPEQTVLRGRVRDQAALHGLLGRLQSLQLDLVEVRTHDESAAVHGLGVR